MRVKILSPHVTYGRVGQTVEAPEGVDVEAQIAAHLVELAKKAAAKDGDEG